MFTLNPRGTFTVFSIGKNYDSIHHVFVVSWWVYTLLSGEEFGKIYKNLRLIHLLPQELTLQISQAMKLF